MKAYYRNNDGTLALFEAAPDEDVEAVRQVVVDQIEADKLSKRPVLIVIEGGK